MYYQLKPLLSEDTAAVYATNNEDYSLTSGERLDEGLELPMTFELDTDEGRIMPTFLALPEPLFRKDFYGALVAAGVDNLDAYPAVITNPETGEQIEDYVAVNIVGLVSCADMQASEYDELAERNVIQALVIDPARAGDNLMFRLAEDPLVILVSDRVVSRLPLAAFPDVDFERVLERT